MTIQFRPTSTARYMVALRYLDGSSSPFKAYCDTIADVQKSVNRTLKGMRMFAKAKGSEVHICPPNGTKVYAAAIQNAATFRRTYFVAKGGGMDLAIIPLK